MAISNVVSYIDIISEANVNNMAILSSNKSKCLFLCFISNIKEYIAKKTQIPSKNKVNLLTYVLRFFFILLIPTILKL